MDTGGTQTAVNGQSEASEGLSRVAAAGFSERWKHAKDEQQEAQSFWQEFFRDVCLIPDLKEQRIEFEKKVISSNKGTTTRIDVFWPDTVLIEHKSLGKDLEAAEQQAREYIISLPPAQRPPAIIVCDFQTFRIIDILRNTTAQFALAELPDNLDRIEALIGHKTQAATTVEVEADQQAAHLMADLYREFAKNGYEGHDTSVFMVRILFCLFADDTRMWQTGLFNAFLQDTSEDGRDVGARIQQLFEILDVPRDQRPKVMDPFLQDFPYVNGGLFRERLPGFFFTPSMRTALLAASAYDWSQINTTIFGAMFQDIKSKADRRAGGEHYTSEKNIDKALYPLFLDELNDRLQAAWDNPTKLKNLQQDLGQIQILDPACGSGNFLITAYKRLRGLELDIMRRRKQLDGTAGQISLIDGTLDIYVNLSQLHGIEYEEWSSQIATVAIFLTDHQENLKLELVVGAAPDRFPLTKSANIVHGNALQVDWSDVCPMGENTIIVGNPPFLGQHLQNAEQKSDTRTVWRNHKKTGVMDYVSNWHVIAARLQKNSSLRAAFVSTNSITQGEQVAPLWGEFVENGVGIDFAHRTFAWTNEAKGQAAVHVVIVGFSSRTKPKKRPLWIYPSAKGKPVLEQAENINLYLLNGPEVAITSRTKPLNEELPPMLWGSKPTDGGFLSKIDPSEAESIHKNDPIAAKYLRPLIGSEEMINGGERYCLWLVDAEPADLRNSPVIRDRVESVRQMRLGSVAASTRDAATYAHRFRQVAQPGTNYLGVPRVSSENRPYVPLAFYSPEIIASDALLTIPNATESLFALLNSKAFQVWNSVVSGRLESRFRISQEITYNNFPLPHLTDEQTKELMERGREILDARAAHPTSSLADLYDPRSMPTALLQAHKRNDRTNAKIFGYSYDASDETIAAELFKRYIALAG